MTLRTTLSAIALIVALAPGCGDANRGTPDPDPAPQHPPAPAAAPQREPDVAPESGASIRLESPKDGEVIGANPIVIAGTARTFENNVVIRLLDDSGRMIREFATTATGEIGQFNPFRVETWITRWPGSHLTIQAIEHSAKDGSIRTRVSSTVRIDAPKETIRLDFAKSEATDCTDLVTVERELPLSVGRARLTLEALLTGPTEEESELGATSPFPRGADIRSISLRDGTLVVDFNEAMTNVGGSCRARALRAMIERSLRRIDGVEQVTIHAMGDEALALQP